MEEDPIWNHTSGFRNDCDCDFIETVSEMAVGALEQFEINVYANV